MRALLVSTDSTIPNLFLMKVSAAVKRGGGKQGFPSKNRHTHSFLAFSGRTGGRPCLLLKC